MAGIKLLKIIDDIRKEDWASFVYSHPRGNIFQTEEIYDVYKDTKNYLPIKLFCIDEDTGELVGVLVGSLIKDLNNVLSTYLSRSVIQGGPLALNNSSQISESLLLEYDKYAGKKSVITEIRHLFDCPDLHNIGSYKFEGHLNFLINLNQSEDQLWTQIHKSRRKNIKNAEKEGVIVEEMAEENLIPAFYDLLNETYRKVKTPLADISLFKSAFNKLVPKNMVKFFLLKRNNEYVGARSVLVYKGLVYDWYAGSSQEASFLSPDSCLVWHILKWGIQNNYKTFDFGGGGKPNVEYGPREFKRRFGGELVNYGRSNKVHSGIKFGIAKKGLEIYRKIS